MSPSPLVVLAAAFTAVAVGLLIHVIAPPPRSLSSRVLPYLMPTTRATTTTSGRGAFLDVFAPIVGNFSAWLSGLVERRGPEHTVLRLRQAGWYLDLDDDQMLAAYRSSQVKAVFAASALGFGTAWISGLPVTTRVVLTLLGFVVGLTRHRGRLDRAVEERRELMRIEIYTVNQLLAMRVRAGGGVIQAVQSIVDRGQGAVVAELGQALRLHRAGWRGSDALRRIAESTPEPFCSRTYRLLASAEERGTDLASALLALSEDVREARREAIKRSATKRRAAMLVPTIAVLAPVLIIFVAAPLPYLITGWQ